MYMKMFRTGENRIEFIGLISNSTWDSMPSKKKDFISSKFVVAGMNIDIQLDQEIATYYLITDVFPPKHRPVFVITELNPKQEIEIELPVRATYEEDVAKDIIKQFVQHRLTHLDSPQLQAMIDEDVNKIIENNPSLDPNFWTLEKRKRARYEYQEQLKDHLAVKFNEAYKIHRVTVE